MSWAGPKCSNCGCEIKGIQEEGLVISKSTGKKYRNSAEFTAAKEKLSNISILCKICGSTESKQLEENIYKFDNMIITTTATIEGKNIIQYSGIVTAQVFMGVNIFRDIFSGVRDIVGGRSKSMENELNRAKDLLIKEIKEEAIMLNANAIVGLKIDFEDVGKTSGNAFMLFGTGTAVVL